MKRFFNRSVFLYNEEMMNEQFIWYAVKDSRLIAGTTKRQGGSSKPPFDSLNMAFHTGDDMESVHTNRQLFSKMIQIDLNKMIFTNQSHSTVLKKVTSKDGGKGSYQYEDGIVADALYTTESNVLLGIFHADCVPVFIYHPSLPLVAVIHAGTIGSLKGITQLVIDQLVKETNIQPTELIAHLGPSLDFAHHPISEARAIELLTSNPNHGAIIKKIGGTSYLDIPLLNYLQLVDAGLKPNHIHVSNLDTLSNPNDYFSYDRDQKTGRHVSFVYLK
jgi:YfiH family protein